MAKPAAHTGSTASRYQILCKLAVGGMAEIFLARASSVANVEHYCVLKRILHDRARNAEFVQMFLDEARLAAQLQHPNIASVYDIGVLGDSYFFTMEYVHGETVLSLLQRAQAVRRSVPLGCVLTIVAGAAAGLHHAHERNSKDGRPLGIVHRDVSPSNLMVSYAGGVKIVDFGVAKAADRGVETRAGTVKGKLSYMSPEQCSGEQVARRSDLVSLGIVMWEMRTGARLYRRASALETMVAIVSDPPPPPSTRRSEVPPAVEDIVLRLLAKSVDDRFQTAAEVVEAIEDASSQAGTTLSALPVSRLVRELFGARAEPWLELESGALSGERASQDLTLIARSLEFSQTDGVDAEFEAILDAMGSHAPSAARSTSPPTSEVTTVGWMAPAVSAAALSPRIPISSAAPSSLSASSPPGASSPAVFGVTGRTAVPVAGPSPAFAPVAPNMPSPAIASAGTAAAFSPLSAPVTPSALHSHGGPSKPGIMVVGLPYGSVPIAAAARSIATAGPNATPPHGATVATAPMPSQFDAAILASHFDSDPRPDPGERQPAWDSRSSLSAGAAPASRIPWRLVAVITTGIAIGVGTAWLSTRAFQRESVAVRRSVAVPAPAETVMVVPSTAPAPPPPVGASTPAIHEVADAPRNDPAEIDFSDSSDSIDDSVPSKSPDFARPIPAPAPDPNQDPPAVRPTFKKLAAQYATHDYSSIVASCRDANTRVSIAWVCLMAACHLNDVAEAKRWLLVSRPARRAKFAAACQQVGGIDLRASTRDCAADRFDCR